MELNLDDKTPQINNIPKVPSITRISENHQYKKSKIIEIKNPQKSEYIESTKFSHIISPQDYDGLFRFRQTTRNELVIKLNNRYRQVQEGRHKKSSYPKIKRLSSYHK